MDYCATITSSVPPSEAARRIVQDLEQWWSTRVERSADGFTIRFNKSHASFTFDRGGSGQHFAWTCTDAHMVMDGVEDASEWAGTQLIWSVDAAPQGSTVTLTHKGLTPALPCFDICTRGWEHFFEVSLRDHLNGGTTAPNRT